MTIYLFKRWDNGETNVERIIDIGTLDVTLTATYVAAYNLSVTSSPGNVPFTINGSPQTTPFPITLLETGNYRIIMPLSLMGGYTFKGWSDGVGGVGGNDRIITLNRDMAINAEYELVAPTFDFSMAASPAIQPVTIGNSTSFAVGTILIQSESKVVVLTISGLPTYVSASFNPASNYPPFNSALTVTTSSNTPTGSYILGITGSAGTVSHYVQVTLQVNPVPIQKGTLAIIAKMGDIIIANASGDVTDPSGMTVDSFTNTPHSWDQAIVSLTYTVTCRLVGYPDQAQTATITSDGQSIPVEFKFGGAGFPWWWALAMAFPVVGGIVVTQSGAKNSKRKRKGK